MIISRRSIASLVMILIVLPSLFSMAFPIAPSVHAQSTFTNVTSYRVSGSPNYTSPGSESFWKTINWINVPLAASVSPGGGHTSNLLVKSANDGFNIYMLLRWNDTSGPSFLSENEVYRASNGSLEPLTPADTQNVTQLYYNSTYYYPDRAAILWFVANQSQRQQSPVMQLGTDGAITGGAAEIWHWQSNPTDNNQSDTGFPGGYTDSAGNPIFPADNLSFAEDDYTNTTGFFVIAGNFGAGAPNLAPDADPFEVHVGSYYSYADKTWTVEMVRSFTTSDASQYRVQLQSGSSYFIALAVWQGKLGESSDFKSVSQWYNVTVSSLAPPPPVTSPGGVTVPLAIAVAVSALIVGIAIGTIVKPPSKK
jgi:DMSO reductase family type II enzyme heme b subunit